MLYTLASAPAERPTCSGNAEWTPAAAPSRPWTELLLAHTYIYSVNGYPTQHTLRLTRALASVNFNAAVYGADPFQLQQRQHLIGSPTITVC